MEKEKDLAVDSVDSSNNGDPAPKKKGLKWLWIIIALVVAAAVVAWCGYNAYISDKGVDSVFGLSGLLAGLFIITALGYLLGRITIKGVNLGTAGVFLVAIAFGLVCTFIPSDMPILGALSLQAGVGNTVYYKKVIQNVGLVMFVGSVGLIAGPTFFRELKKNFKTYIFMGIVIIIIGTGVALLCTVVSPEAYGPDFWSGVLSGALTSTPGYSAAQDAMANMGKPDTMVTIGHAIAYPFGVIGVVLFVQLMPKFLKVDMKVEREMLKPDVIAARTESDKPLFEIDNLGLAALAISIVSGLVLGAIKIPLFGGVNFSLGTTGGVLIMCLLCGHFGKLGKISLKVPASTLKVLKELGLMLFLIGAGVDGGASLIEAVGGNIDILAWGFIGGAVMTVVPMIVGFFVGKHMLKLPLLNNLGSITGGMTSTPALGTLISTAETEDVAGAYASTYPIALVLLVISCNLMITLIIG